MARTAPVPNIPAPPGMNPGAFVAGGGGDGGGKGGKGSGSGSGDEGANGENGGEDAEGDGNSADECGTGSGSSCNNCSGSTAAGDPVDIATGRVYTLPSIDVAVAGPLALLIKRKYSSHAVARDVGLGFGWAHSFSWEIVVRRRAVELWDHHGTMLQLPLPTQGQEVRKKGRVLVGLAHGFLVRYGGLNLYFLEAADGGKSFKLSSVEDRNHNKISLEYTNSVLTRIVDCVGRVVRVARTGDGHIAAFEVSNGQTFIPFMRFSYLGGDLISATDAGNYATHYTYDAKHYLTSYRDPEGMRFHFVYDQQQRCIETWGALDDGTVPGLSNSSPATLADGTPAKGFMHCRLTFADDYREVADSMQVRRFFVNDRGQVLQSVSNGGVTTREFDADDNLVLHQDALGGETRWKYDSRGNTVEMLDQLGHVTRWLWNSFDLADEVSDEVGVIVRNRYDARGNVVERQLSNGAVTRYVRDAQGNATEEMMPNGGLVRREFDAQGNLVRVTDPDGAVWCYAYDAFGNMVSQTNPANMTLSLAYDVRNLPIEKRFANGSIERYRQNGRRQIIEYRDSDGGTLKLSYLMGRIRTRVEADGSVREYRYNREGFLVEVFNEKGEVYVNAHNPDGIVTDVVSFTGRRQNFQHDAMNRVVAFTNGEGELTEWERDARGQIVGITYPDGTTAAFTYDARGRMVASTSEAGEFAYELNPSDLLLKESHTLDGETHVVSHDYDVMRGRTRMETSLNHSLITRRDLAGRGIESSVDASETIRFGYDVIGREIERVLPGGGAIKSEHGADGPPVRRWVNGPSTRKRVNGPKEPDWVGPRPTSYSVDKVFRYSPGVKRIVERWDSSFGDRSYEYDARDQLVSVKRNGSVIDRYQYDTAGNHQRASEPRRYGLGNQLMERGNVEYRWDLDGRLVEKIERSQAGDRVWTYGWRGNDLRSVETPDGRIVEYLYDPFSRRVAKTVKRRSALGGLETVSSSRFIWDKDRITHEIKRSSDAKGDPVVSEKTFLYDEQYGSPLAERTDTLAAGARLNGAWSYHVNDPIGTPEHMVDGAGQVVGELERDEWGELRGSGVGAESPARFKGQYFDEETGLHYNRYRYYDPQAGRYISEDPAGGLPDSNTYRYAPNPISWIDFYGLHTATAFFTPPGGESTAMNGGRPYVSKYRSEAGTLSGPFSHQYNQDNNLHPMGNFASRDENGNLAHRTSDTEAQIIRDLEHMESNGQNLEGSHCHINGQLPPCSSCHQRMREFAQSRNMTMSYTYGGQTIDYPSGQMRLPGF